MDLWLMWIFTGMCIVAWVKILLWFLYSYFLLGMHDFFYRLYKKKIIKYFSKKCKTGSHWYKANTKEKRHNKYWQGNSHSFSFSLTSFICSLSWAPRCFAVLSRFSHVWLFATLWMVAHRAPLSMGFSRHEHWSALPCPPPGDLPDPRDRTCVSCISYIGRWILYH